MVLKKEKKRGGVWNWSEREGLLHIGKIIGVLATWDIFSTILNVQT